MTVDRIEPEEARRLLESGEGHVYLDVRSREEFASGHVPGAVNIPLLERSPGAPRLMPNPRFADEVEERFSKETKLIVGCQRGGRSLRAAELLVARGFTGIVDMRGGYDGEMDRQGTITFPGWARRGLPTETGGE